MIKIVDTSFKEVSFCLESLQHQLYVVEMFIKNLWKNKKIIQVLQIPWTFGMLQVHSLIQMGFRLIHKYSMVWWRLLILDLWYALCRSKSVKYWFPLRLPRIFWIRGRGCLSGIVFGIKFLGVTTHSNGHIFFLNNNNWGGDE